MAEWKAVTTEVNCACQLVNGLGQAVGNLQEGEKS